ncbi:MAG: ABC transporter substrate-binding protein [Acutalibacteraceae bacterium]
MFKKITALLLTVVMLLSFMVGCNGSDDGTVSGDYPVTVENIEFKKAPQGVVALCDSVADIIVACSLEAKLKGRSDECTQDELSVLPSVGSKSSPDTSKIIDLDVDLVFADSTLFKDARQKLENAGITVVTMKPATDRASLKTLYVNICSILAGQTTGGNRGETAVNNILSTFDDLIVTLESDTTSALTACYIIDGTLNTIDETSFGNELIKYTKARNVAESTETSFVDNIKLANPQYIFCNTGLKDTILEDERFENVIAVKNDNVYELDYSYMTRQGQTMIDCVLFMAKIMYPHLATSDSSSEDASVDNSSSNGDTTSSTSVDSGIPDNVTLKYDDENEYVLILQKRLDELGYMAYEPTGYFGASTQQAVSDFQFYNYEYLTDGVTGIADPETIAVLFSSKAYRRPEPLR